MAKPKDEMLAPSLALLMKLGSIAVHADEMLSTDGHVFDRVALKSLLTDPDVVAWIKKMGELLPRKRRS